jgi:hypothetical protein
LSNGHPTPRRALAVTLAGAALLLLSLRDFAAGGFLAFETFGGWIMPSNNRAEMAPYLAPYLGLAALLVLLGAAGAAGGAGVIGRSRWGLPLGLAAAAGGLLLVSTSARN